MLIKTIKFSFFLGAIIRWGENFLFLYTVFWYYFEVAISSEKGSCKKLVECGNLT